MYVQRTIWCDSNFHVIFYHRSNFLNVVMGLSQFYYLHPNKVLRISLNDRRNSRRFSILLCARFYCCCCFTSHMSERERLDFETCFEYCVSVYFDFKRVMRNIFHHTICRIEASRAIWRHWHFNVCILYCIIKPHNIRIQCMRFR